MEPPEDTPRLTRARTRDAAGLNAVFMASRRIGRAPAPKRQQGAVLESGGGGAGAAAAPPRAKRVKVPSARGLSFGDVHVREYKRAVLGDGVPSEGGFPLALAHGVPHLAERRLGTVNEFEERKAKELEDRQAALPDTHQVLATGETRQFDFRADATGARVQNPLFAKLDEKARKQILSDNDAHVELGSLVKDNKEFQRHLKTVLSDVPPICKCRPPLAGAKSWPLAKIRKELSARGEPATGSKAALLDRIMGLEAVAKEWDEFECCKPLGPEGTARAGTGEAVPPSWEPVRCPCAEAGIECHQFCSCGTDGNCRNPLGTAVFDEKEVSAHRVGVLAKANKPPRAPAPRRGRR